MKKLLLWVCLFVSVAAVPGLANAKFSEDDIRDTMRRGSPTEVEEKLQSVLAERPNNALAWYWLSQSLEKQGRLPESRLALEKASKLYPDMPFADKAKLKSLSEKFGYMDASSVTKGRLEKIERSSYVNVPAPETGWLALAIQLSLIVLLTSTAYARYVWETSMEKKEKEEADVAEK